MNLLLLALLTPAALWLFVVCTVGFAIVSSPATRRAMLAELRAEMAKLRKAWARAVEGSP